MAKGQEKKKTARKRPQPSKVAGRAASKAAVKAQAKGDGAAKTPKKRSLQKLDRRKLSAMVDRMLLQLAEQVEEGTCKITTSEGMKLIQLRESLGLERPSTVRVEWVEPKAA